MAKKHNVYTLISLKFFSNYVLYYNKIIRKKTYIPTSITYNIICMLCLCNDLCMREHKTSSVDYK